MKNTRAFFDQLADTWEDQSFPLETRKRVAELAGAFGIQKGTWVLDIATGTGILHPYLLQAVGESGRVFAFDFSYEMLQKAKNKAPLENLYCLQASAMAVPLPDNLFDYIICFAAFPHFANHIQALQEMARVAKKRAKVFIAHLMSRDELIKHHGSHSPVAGDTVPEEMDMRRIFQQSGFTDVEIINRPGLYLARGIKT